MGLYTNIEAALNTQLSTLGSLPPVQWPNSNYMPAEGTLFLRPTLLPAVGALDTLAGSYLNKGLYQIDVFCPLNEGISTLTSWLDAIFTLFSGSKTLTANGQNVFVQDIVQGKSDRQDGWYVGSITIHYNCYS